MVECDKRKNVDGPDFFQFVVEVYEKAFKNF